MGSNTDVLLKILDFFMGLFRKLIDSGFLEGFM